MTNYTFYTYQNSLFSLEKMTDRRRSLDDVDQLVDAVHWRVTCHPASECLGELRLVLSHTHRQTASTTVSVPAIHNAQSIIDFNNDIQKKTKICRAHNCRIV